MTAFVRFVYFLESHFLNVFFYEIVVKHILVVSSVFYAFFFTLSRIIFLLECLVGFFVKLMLFLSPFFITVVLFLELLECHLPCLDFLGLYHVCVILVAPSWRSFIFCFYYNLLIMHLRCWYFTFY